MRGKYSSAFAGVLLLVLAAGAGRAQNVLDPFGAQPGGTSFNDDSPLQGPRLYWKNGEHMDVVLMAADDRSITFRSGLFADPVPLRASALSRVDFPPASAASAMPAFAILLKNGDCLYSDIASVKAGGLELRSERHGEMVVPLAVVQSVRRLKTDHILYTGPQGAEGWAHYGLRDVQGFPWSAGEHGGMITRVWNRSAMLPMALPDSFQADVVLSSGTQLRFALSFGQASNSAQHMAIETWDDELVIAQASRFQPLRTLGGDDRVLALRICWDRKQNRLRVYDWSGALMGEFKTEPVSPDKPCVLLRNKGAMLALEHLSIRAWDGGGPARRDSLQGWIEKLDGSLVQGKIQAGADSSSLVAGAATVPLAEVAAFDSGPDDPGQMKAKKMPLAQMLIETPRPEATPTRIRYSDGTLLSGELAGMKDGRISLRSPLLPHPVSGLVAGMTRLVLNERVQPGTPIDPPLAQMDTLHVGSNAYLHGSLEGTGDALLRWRLPAALEPVALAKRTDVEIRRPVRDVPAAPALVFFKDGNVLGASLKSVSEKEVRIHSGVAEVSALPPEQLAAIHFNSRKLEARGFGDAGWQSVRGTPAEVERRSADKVLIKGAGAFGHSTILAGDELSFTMGAPSFWGALAVELFAPDMESHSKSVQLHLIYSGSDFWVVLETGDNNSRSSEQLRNLTRKEIDVRLVFSEDTLQVFANGIPVLSTSLEAALRKGPGIIFSGSGMWGSPTRDVEVSNFAVNARPDFLQVPQVGEEARRNVLTIPRSRRESPPTHVLLAPNGDLLRGRLESATADTITFVSGLDTLQVPAERVTAAVWLEKPKSQDPKSPEAVRAPSQDDAFAQALATHWLVLQDGSRIGLKVDKFERDRISGWSSSLGAVNLPLDQLAVLRLSPPQPSAAMLAYRGWQPEMAPEPVLPETGGQSSPLLGKAAPDFSLPVLGGGQFSLSAQKGKVTVLDFWATWCGPCVASLPEQLKAMAGLDPARVQFVAVNQGEPEPLVAKFLQARGWQMTVALDAAQDVGRKYGAESIPHCVVVGPDGKVIWVTSGYTPGESQKMASMIKKLLGM